MKRIDWNYRGINLSGYLTAGVKKGMPLLIYLTESLAEAEKAQPVLQTAFQGSIGILTLALPEAEAVCEDALGDLLYALREEESVGETQMYLSGNLPCSDMVWQLASHFPDCFAAVAVVGGYADPYDARNLKFVPLRAYDTAEMADLPQGGQLKTKPQKTVMGIRTCGGELAELFMLKTGGQSGAALFSETDTAAWMLKQDRKQQFYYEMLKPGLWRIDDYFTSSCYLIEGREKALLIDTGMGEGDLPGLIRRLTNLPVEVTVTHPHRDHLYRGERFEIVYLHKRDIEIIIENPEAYKEAIDVQQRGTKLAPIDHDSIIDLGGTEVETVFLGGHTPHSVVFIDDSHRAVYTGDAIGSGYIALMICEETALYPYIQTYKENLQGFLAYMPRIRNYAWLGGHGIQENGCNLRNQQDFRMHKSAYFNPIREQVVIDMICLCDKILQKEISMEQIRKEKEHYCHYGDAGMYFRFV